MEVKSRHVLSKTFSLHNHKELNFDDNQSTNHEKHLRELQEDGWPSQDMHGLQVRSVLWGGLPAVASAGAQKGVQTLGKNFGVALLL